MSTQPIPPFRPAFPGQHDNERILYEFGPHWSRSLVIFAVTCGSALLAFAVAYFRATAWSAVFGPEHLARMWEYFAYLMAAALLAFLYDYWRSKKLRIFITDRRIVRLDFLIPFLTRRRALFWRDVAKTKAYSRIPFCALMKVGTIEVIARFSRDESVKVQYVYYYEDLGNYIDKIVDIYNIKPEDLGNVRPFVPKPPGHRY